MSAAKLEPTHVAARLGMCAVALAGAAGIATDANADVVTFSTPIPVPNNFDGVYLNLLTGGTGTSGASIPGWDFNPYNSGSALSFFWNNTAPSVSSGVSASTTGPYLDLAIGSVVSAASTFSAPTAAANTLAFQPAGTHLLGFRFFNEGTGAVNYGYMTLVSEGTNGFPLTIAGWSFENTGAAVTVVPEPASGLMLAMGGLALGALHLRRLRRERRQQAH